MKLLRIILSVVLIVGAGSVLLAVDPPHWTSVATYEDCSTSCHALHSSAGTTLTQAAGNVNLCQSCHNSTDTNLPINTVDRADPIGRTGYHHGFGVPAVNATYNTVTPTNAEMALRVMGGQIVCSTCHDQHKADSSKGGDSRVGQTAVLVNPNGLGTMTGSTAAGLSYTGAAGAWYYVEIDGAGTQATATFRWSKDNGTTWMGTGVSCGNGAPVALDNNIVVTFTGGAGAFQVGDSWEFYASWPFLQAQLDTGDNATGVKFCRDCHTNWVMTHTDAETYTGTPRSHPVGVALGVNGRGYDRAAPLDGDGTADDGLSGNDLALDGTLVQCMTCHGVHYADGNSQTEEAP